MSKDGLLRTVDDQLRPEHAALVVVDMQNDFCAEGGWTHKERGHDVSGCKAIAANIGALAAAARRAGAPVVWIRAIYDFKYLNGAQIAKRGKEGCCLEGTWGADFFEIRPEPGDIVSDKHSFSAFKDTDLDQRLRARGVKTLIMTGVATNVCVDSTLREGFFLGYHIVLAEDCVGSNNKVGQDGTLATVRYNFGAVIPSSEIIERLCVMVA
jgi:ureidoacrylate peracid hydrolase